VVEELVPKLAICGSFPQLFFADFVEILIDNKQKLTPKSKYSVPLLFAVLVFMKYFQDVTPANNDGRL
jgi:hypothetical protein